MNTVSFSRKQFRSLTVDSVLCFCQCHVQTGDAELLDAAAVDDDDADVRAVMQHYQSMD